MSRAVDVRRWPTLAAAGLIATGLAVTLIQVGRELGQPGLLPPVALLVPLGLGVALVVAGSDITPPFRLGWAAVVAGLLALHLFPHWLRPTHWGLDTWPGLPRGAQVATLAGVSVLALLGVAAPRASLTVPRVVPRILGRLRAHAGRYRFDPDPAPEILSFAFTPTRARWIRLATLGEASAPWGIAAELVDQAQEAATAAWGRFVAKYGGTMAA